MAIKTNPTTSLAGTFWFEINAPNTNANVTVHKMGDISYEFDLVPSDSVVRGIGGIQGSMQVDFFDQLSNMGSLYGSLENSIGTYDGLTATTVPVAPTMLYLLPRGESNIDNAYRWPFDLRFTEVSINERSQTTTATLIPRSTNINIATWSAGSSTNNFPDNVAFRYNNLNFSAYYVGDFINDIVSDFDTSVGNTTIYEPSGGIIAELLGNEYVPYIPTKDFVATSNYSNFFPAMMVLGPDQQYASGNLAVDKVASYAAIDGSIFGSAFGVNFFMGKRNTSYNVEISNSEVSDLKFKPSPRSTNAVIYRLTNTNVINSTANMGNGFPALFNTFAEQPAWVAASQQINIGVSVYSPHLNFGRTSNVDTNYVNGDAAYDSFLFAFPGLTETLWTADATYTTSFATGSFTSNAGIYMIEADILGVDKIRPYEVIKFDNTVPLRYQGKHFRPTSLSYDLKADRVRVSAYQISAFEVVPPEPPDTNVTINVGDCETGEMALMLSYSLENTFNVTSDETGENTSNFLAFNTFTNVFSDEFGNVVTLDGNAYNVTAFSNSDGNVSNLTNINL